MPKLLDNQFTVASDTKITKEVDNKGIVKIDYVIDNSPAAKAGLTQEDRVVSINGQKIEKPEQLSDITKANAGRAVEVTTSKDGATKSSEVTLNTSSPYLGVAPYSAETGFQVRRSTWSAPIVSAGVMKDFTVATFKGLGTAVKGLGSIIAGTFTGNKQARQAGQEDASNQVSGPVGIFAVLYQISEQGFGLVLFVVGLISLALAIMNLLPIPALDGGSLYVMLAFRAFKKPLTTRMEERIRGTGFMLMIFLFIIITIVDVRRTF